MRAAMLGVLAYRVDNERVTFEMAQVMDKADWVERKLFTESELAQMADEVKERYKAVYPEDDESGKKKFYSLDLSPGKAAKFTIT